MSQDKAPAVRRQNPARQILPTIVPALIVGIVSALILYGLSALAKVLENVWWKTLPDAFGIDGTGRVWTVVILTLTGVLAALVVVVMPGHAGPDGSTTSLVDRPLPAFAVPGLALATVISLAGGVSLGPENPIMAVNIGLMVYFGSKLLPKTTAESWSGLAVSATIGALFGTPLAAALALSEIFAGGPRESPQNLWNRLVAPVSAAAAGALTMMALGDSGFSLGLPAYRGFEPIDLVSGSIIAAFAALAGLAGAYLFPYVHRAFALLRHQWIALPIGGLILGVIGAFAGQVSLFKGLAQSQDLAHDALSKVPVYSAWALLGLGLLKVLTTVISSSAGFRGGRIFPAAFSGVAIGLAAHAFVPSVPVSLAVAAGCLGMGMASMRQGWLSIFLALMLVPDISIIPTVVMIALPTWLVVTGRKELQIPKELAIPA